MRKASPRTNRPLTKAQLLPLSTDHVHRLQLQHHLALAALVSGQGDVEQLSCLTSVLHLSYFLRDTGAPDESLIPLLRADIALGACLERAARDESWSLTADEQSAIAQLLLAHDEQLASVRMHRYLDAWEKLQRANATGIRPLSCGVAKVSTGDGPGGDVGKS